ncbi:hypothetical protein MMC30_006522 [Trapelia coarctata]|nr:hypothetical protein [Trapelia coarctata]
MADESKITKSICVTDVDATTFARAVSSKMANLIVGPKRKTFVAHKALIANLVPHFTTTWSRKIPDSKSDDVYLADADLAAVQLLVAWLNRGISALSVERMDLVPLVQLYIAAAKWHLPALQNSIIDALVAHFRHVSNLRPIRDVVQKRYLEARLYPKLQLLLVFQTVIAFNKLSWLFPDKDRDFAVWQVVHADMIQPNKLHYESGIDKQFHVGLWIAGG